mmetsp:Transcript_3465/g.7788  ORF Transcript_3465/g.7788 Transcript_3465/m.7788 type:complete len:80 (-) Transcript_3465:527-766(-)
MDPRGFCAGSLIVAWWGGWRCDQLHPTMMMKKPTKTHMFGATLPATPLRTMPAGAEATTCCVAEAARLAAKSRLKPASK